jgi:hypothetical protein
MKMMCRIDVKMMGGLNEIMCRDASNKNYNRLVSRDVQTRVKLIQRKIKMGG